jgi:hypothetical protein
MWFVSMHNAKISGGCKTSAGLPCVRPAWA